jgi:hypothetical protein
MMRKRQQRRYPHKAHRRVRNHVGYEKTTAPVFKVGAMLGCIPELNDHWRDEVFRRAREHFTDTAFVTIDFYPLDDGIKVAADLGGAVAIAGLAASFQAMFDTHGPPTDPKVFVVQPD